MTKKEKERLAKIMDRLEDILIEIRQEFDLPQQEESPSGDL